MSTFDQVLRTPRGELTYQTFLDALERNGYTGLRIKFKARKPGTGRLRRDPAAPFLKLENTVRRFARRALQA